jgi:hypothetical protein
LLQIVSSLQRTKVRFIPRNLRALDLTIFTPQGGIACLAIPVIAMPLLGTCGEFSNIDGLAKTPPSRAC